MNQLFQKLVIKASGASAISKSELIQALWSGYGELRRYYLQDSPHATVIVKWVQLNKAGQHHPRGWSGKISHQRKRQSYQVEGAWYAQYASQTKARLPQCLAFKESDNEMLLVLEDLDQAGFKLRKSTLNWPEIKACISWLAQFHADFMGKDLPRLWSTGSYWHLATRRQEWEAIVDKKLKDAAEAIDQKLAAAQHQTIIHGDAKVANFCFSPEGSVAGVDFQYVGRGCGMKDLAYFVGSVLSEEECEAKEQSILDFYFKALAAARGNSVSAIEKEWRPLYRVAWADFYRFLKGWSPDHWKINSYSERVTQSVIEAL
jgi:aminoglycoside phosphotransferase